MAQTGGTDETADGKAVRRHRLSTRLWHWLNAIAVIALLMSGLMIFNAHPRLYWGHAGANADPAWLEIGAGRDVAFPGWLTIPSYYSLADARLWHLAFAWVLALALLAYLLASLVNGHARRDLHLTRADWRLDALVGSVRDHAPLRYTALQKLLYAGVLFGLLPLAIATGLGMSPGIDAAWPWLVDVLGGRQSARSLHFITAAALVGFFLVHMLGLILAGPLVHMRAMITGRMTVPPGTGEAA